MADQAPLASRMLLGAVAGLVGTAAMTSAMSRLHARLPPDERYPLPPRELVEPLAGPAAGDALVKDLTTAAHFGFGAGVAAIAAGVAPRMGLGGWTVLGPAVWAASYFGWAPALMGMKPADRHPLRRNALMAGVHLLWGAAAGAVLHELLLSRETMLASGPLRDRRD